MTGMNRATGKALGDEVEHIRQSVTDILTTPIGSRVKRRDYGSLLPELIDQPFNGITQLRMFGAVAVALMRWEPRGRAATCAVPACAARCSWAPTCAAPTCAVPT